MLRFAPHQFPESRDMLALSQQGANRNAHHPAPIQRGRREIGSAGAVRALRPAQRVPVQRLTGQARWLVADTNRLKGHRSQHAPVGRCLDLFSKPLRVSKITAQARLQTGYALLADQTPEFQRAEAPPQWNAPIAQVLDPIRSEE